MGRDNGEWALLPLHFLSVCQERLKDLSHNIILAHNDVDIGELNAVSTTINQVNQKKAITK
ncbi:LOW QUALITY PROTEIN: hypothetical protein TorRG33x02_194800 [Trema orientale]|uniref:Uncharacterized protein n=1 Tax=Trema orientale TaxID=63057 RepID=A0A2P5EGV4_TREOI|nr:LOW QUALITY PROTEIN: hypothetical protein TorRG33x02_194800 [Trema orientale]